MNKKIRIPNITKVLVNLPIKLIDTVKFHTIIFTFETKEFL